MHFAHHPEVEVLLHNTAGEITHLKAKDLMEILYVQTCMHQGNQS